MITSSSKITIEKTIVHTRIPDDNAIRDMYIVGKKLGEGSFGKVHEGIHRETNEKWAIKSISKEKAGTTGLKLMEREVSILKRVRHPNIIELNEVIESPKRMFLVLELCEGGELADALKQKVYFTEQEVKTIMQKLSSAVSYLHKNDIVHRDIKLENILLSQNPEDENDMLHIKLTDFGLSVVKGGQGFDNMMQDFCGTPMYMAPEIIENKTYSQQCDVWAMGVIAYILLCGNAPFPAPDEETLTELIKKADIDFSADVWNTISPEAKKCIQGMLKADPAHRLSAAEVFDHPWFTGKTTDDSEPRNVLEMMKSWAPELKRENCPITDDDLLSVNGQVALCESEDSTAVDSREHVVEIQVKESEDPKPSSSGRSNSVSISLPPRGTSDTSNRRSKTALDVVPESSGTQKTTIKPSDTRHPPSASKLPTPKTSITSMKYRKSLTSTRSAPSFVRTNSSSLKPQSTKKK